jgi:signal transduction histidine kinase
MKIFQKTFITVFSFVVLIIVLLSYVLASSHINDSENALIEQNRIYGRLISKQIEVGFFQSDWPYETLSDLSKRDSFLFWWVVKDDGTIYRSDNVSFMRTNAYEYFPQLRNQTNVDDTIYSSKEHNYAIYFKSFQYGSEVWTIWIGFSLDEIALTTTNIIITVALAFIFVLLVITAVLYLLVGSFTKPIVKLWNTVSEVGKGNFNASSDIRSNDETGHLASELNTMITNLRDSRSKIEEDSKMLEKLVQQKEAFINQLGHDLKTPLSPLVTLVPLLQQEEQNQKRKELLEIIWRNIDYMRNIVMKTVDLAYLNSPNVYFHFMEINLLDTMNETIYSNKTKLDGKQMSIVTNIPDDFMVLADKTRLRELIMNLLDNSMKYSSNGGSITIDAKQNFDFIQVSIHDQGLGMSTEQLSHVFEEFYKADPARHDLKSSGLGLTICKRIVEKHGGKIWVESEGLGKGTTFYFTLPTSKKPTATSKEYENLHRNIDSLFDSKKIGMPGRETKFNSPRNGFY